MTSNLVLLEHLNFNLRSEAVLEGARHLLCHGLGFVEDPRPETEMQRRATLLWANAGLQQLHLPVDRLAGGSMAADAQALDGEITLAVPAGTAAAFAAQLERAGAKPVLEADGDGGGAVAVTALGNAFRLVEVAAHAGVDGRSPFVGGAPSCRGQPGFTAEDAAAAAAASAAATDSSAGAVLRPLGIQSLRIRAPAAALPCIAAFWRDVMGARGQRFHRHDAPAAAAQHDDGDAPASPRQPTATDGGSNSGNSVTPAASQPPPPPPLLTRVRVLFDGHGGGGSGGDAAAASDAPPAVLPASQWIDFVAPVASDHEAGGSGEGRPLRPYDGHHIALDLRDWEAAYTRAAAAGVLYLQTRFTDRCRTLDEARAYHQFRTIGMRGRAAAAGEGEDGACGVCGTQACGGWRLELEVRATSHPACPL